MERNKDILMKLAIFIILIVYTAAATCGDGIKAGTEQSNRFQRLTFTFARCKDQFHPRQNYLQLLPDIFQRVPLCCFSSYKRLIMKK